MGRNKRNKKSKRKDDKRRVKKSQQTPIREQPADKQKIKQPKQSDRKPAKTTHEITEGWLDSEEEVARLRDKLAKFGEKYQPFFYIVFGAVSAIVIGIWTLMGEEKRCHAFFNCPPQEVKITLSPYCTYDPNFCHNYLPHSPSPSSVEKYCGTMKQPPQQSRATSPSK